jgi:hypothetical protein
LKLNFILLALVILASDLVATPIDLGGGDGQEQGEGLYDFEEDDSFGDIDKTVKATSPEPAQESSEVNLANKPLENETLKEPAVERTPTSSSSSSSSASPLSRRAFGAYAKVAKTPSTGIGSNTFEDAAPAEPTPVAAPEPIKRNVVNVVREQYRPDPPKPIYSPQRSVKEQLEEVAQRGTDEINRVYDDKNKVRREERERFQRCTGSAYESYEKVRKELETINVSEKNKKSAEERGMDALREYEENLKLARETTRH